MKGLKYQLKSVLRDKFCLMTFLLPILAALDIIAQRRNVPVAQVAINWTTQCGVVDTSLTGVRNAAEAVENTAAMSWSLDAEEIAQINAAIHTHLDSADKDGR